MLAWSEAYDVGHHDMDRQHRELVNSINEIDDTIRTGDTSRLAHLLKVLRYAAEEHFHAENALLHGFLLGTHKSKHSTAGPKQRLTTAAFDKHTGVHDALLKGLDNIALEPIGAIMDRLKFWFVHHVVREDSHIKALFQAP
jgi:hemerythrin-like metal-binding protein